MEEWLIDVDQQLKVDYEGRRRCSRQQPWRLDHNMLGLGWGISVEALPDFEHKPNKQCVDISISLDNIMLDLEWGISA